MNTLMNVVYIAFAAVFVSAQFNTALADVVSPTPIFLSTFSTHTPALVTRISHASLVFSLAPTTNAPTTNAPSLARAVRSFSLPRPSLLLDDDPSGWRKGPSFEERGG